MAIVPEIDDPNADKSNEDSSDISAQSTQSNITQPTAAASTGGTSVGNGAQAAAKGPSSSGSFQDFSKFKAANTNKLSALTNLATDTAQSKVGGAASAFNDVGAAFKGDVEKNKVDFGTGTKAADGSYDVDSFGKKLDASAQKVDTGKQQGALAGTQQYTDLNNAENLVTNLNSRAGTSALLNETGNGVSASANNTDAMLLRSQADYRNKANEIAQSNKGVTENSLKANQDAIAKAGNDVNTNNASARAAALEQLKGERVGIDADLNAKAAGQEANRTQTLSKDLTDKQTAVRQQAIDAANNKIYMATSEPPPVKPTYINTAGMNLLQKQSAMAKNQAMQAEYDNAASTYNARRSEAMRLANMPAEERYKALGIDEKLNAASAQATGATPDSGYSANTILANDAGTQAKLNALNQLLNRGGVTGVGQQYDVNATGPKTSNNLAAFDELVAQLNNQLNSSLGTYQNDKYAVAPEFMRNNTKSLNGK